MVNNGDGTFTIEPDRAPYELLHNPPPEFWRHHMGHLVDVDNDDDLDLVLGQMRELGPKHNNQSSLVLVNDGTGHYRERIELPHPVFNDGYTHVPGITHFDVNGDEYQDLFIAHERNDGGPSGVLPWTGRYIQVLVNRADGTFGDETLTWMSDQSATTPEYNPEGEEMSNGDVRLEMHDVDRDGCLDLVGARSPYPVRAESPYAYLNNGSGQFEAAPREPFIESEEPWFGHRAVPADVNGDGVIDFVLPLRDDGPDDVWGNDDDVSVLMTLLNSTPLRPIRCTEEE